MTLSASVTALYPYTILLLATLFILPDHVRAQAHFVDCSFLTGNEATLIIPSEAEPTLNGVPLAAGDEIAVYTPRGTCGGVGVWKNASLALTVWGDDQFTEDLTEGFTEGEVISFRLWDASAATEYGGDLVDLEVSYTSDPPYSDSGVYQKNGIYLLTGFAAQTNSTVDAPELEEKPRAYRLAPNYPNPFNSSTAISYELIRSGWTTLVVYDMLGRQVKKLVDERQEAGRYEVKFTAAGLPSGRYIYRLESGGFSDHATMILTN